MSAADFRQVAHRNPRGRTERLFRAAVSAFCSLTRPTRRETVQLAQLTLPLFDGVSVEAKRYVAAALSESRSAPHALVLRLADESVDIAAPVLLRSSVLSNADLVGLIARHGLEHARVIARRPTLDTAIRGLITALVEAESRVAADRPSSEELSAAFPPYPDEAPISDDRGTGIGFARRQLRIMMSDAGAEANAAAMLAAEAPSPSPRESYLRLKATVLGGSALFRTALADALGIDYQTARTIADAPSYDDLIAAMRHFDLSEEEAFLLVCAACPTRFLYPRAVRTFIEKFRQLDAGAAADIVKGWRTRPGPARAATDDVPDRGATVLALASRRKPSVRRA